MAFKSSITESIVVDSLIQFQIKANIYYEDYFYEKANVYQDTNFNKMEKRSFFIQGKNLLLNAYELMNIWTKLTKKEKNIFHLSYESLSNALSFTSSKREYYICARF